MRIKLLTTTLFVALHAMAQPNIREGMYLHLNSHAFISGETINISAYCISESTGRLSKLSTIAYIEIIGEEGPIFQDKIKLQNGRGQTSFFIPSLVLSGTYQVIAYTRWMKNWQDYFIAPVTIINPYEELNNSPQKVTRSSLKIFRDPSSDSLIYQFTGLDPTKMYQGRVIDSAGETFTRFQPDSFGLGKLPLPPLSDEFEVVMEDSGNNLSFFSVDSIYTAKNTWGIDVPNLDKRSLDRSFSPRTSAEILLSLEKGSYSISVRKRDANYYRAGRHAVFRNNQYIKNEVIDPDEYAEKQPEDVNLLAAVSSRLEYKNNPDSLWIVPEVREEILSGKVTVKDGIDDGIPLTLTVKSDPIQLRSTRTLPGGYFYIPFTGSDLEYQAILTPLNFKNYDISFDKRFLGDYPEADFSTPLLDSLQIVEIIDRSIRNQVENAYYEKDTANADSTAWVPQINFDYEYDLDNYARFPTIRQTLIEFVITVAGRASPPFIRPIVGDEYSTTPLLLIDGVPIADEEMVDFNPYRLKMIKVLNNTYFIGSVNYDGVVAFLTKEGYGDYFDNKDIYKKLTVKPLTSFDNSVYSPGIAPSHEPDFRDQLYWNPHLNVTNNKEQAIRFSTSDVTGVFEMVIEGFTSDGTAVSRIYSFEVNE